jgi:hypothetical protein
MKEKQVMVKYLLGLVAGMSIVPFVYLSQSVTVLSPTFYIITLGVPFIIIAFTAFLAFKTKVGEL